MNNVFKYFENIPEEIQADLPLKRIGKEKGWTLTMNNDGELRLAYNVYWK